jgi:hypothetical protein
MNWVGHVSGGANLQAQFRLGSASFGAQADIHSSSSGKIAVRTNTSEQAQLALVGIAIPLLHACLKWISSATPPPPHKKTQNPETDLLLFR